MIRQHLRAFFPLVLAVFTVAFLGILDASPAKAPTAKSAMVSSPPGCDIPSLRKSTTDEAFVDYLYCYLLERAPDAGGAKANLAELKNGLSRTKLFLKFYTCDEFNNQSYLKGTVRQIPDKEFIPFVFSRLLSRAPKKTELQTWEKKLQEDNFSKDTMVKEVLKSKEMKALHHLTN